MSPVSQVTVLSTGAVQIRPEHAESNGTPLLWWLNTSRRWTDPRPINVYVIEHAQGLVLFDTGQDRRSITDPTYFPKGFVGHNYHRLARFDIPEGATLTEQLRANGYDIGDVRFAILSHLHQDHIGGLRELPASAQVLVSATELASVDKRFAVLAGLMREHILLPASPGSPSLHGPSRMSRSPRSPRLTTSWATVRSCSCPLPATRPGRCRCCCEAKGCRACSSSAT